MDKLKYLLGALLVISAYAFGFYEGKPKTNTQTTVVSNDVKDKEVDTHVETVTTKDVRGNIRTVTIKDSVLRSEETKIVKTVESTTALSKVHVNALLGYDFHQDKATYGIMVSKKFIGPINVGAFGLTNKTFGVSLGMEF